VIREGGETAPKRLSIKLSENDIHVCWVEAVKRNKYRKYSEHDDAWKQGFVKNPAFYGNVGETAFLFWLQRFMRFKGGVDFVLRRRGDKGKDFIIFGRSYQIKAIHSNKQLANRVAYVKESDERMRYPLEADVYVFFDVSNLHVPEAIGTIGAKRIARMPTKKSPVAKATHWNYIIPFDKLESMATLKDQIFLDRRSHAASLSGV
jgi:hypothetical protein